MKWKIEGVSQATGRHWQLTILARDAEDATAQGRYYSQQPNPITEPDVPGPTVSESSIAAGVIDVLILPAILVVLVAKSFVYFMSYIRRLIAS